MRKQWVKSAQSYERGFVFILIVLTMLAIGGAMVFTGIAANLVGRARVDAEATATSDVLQQAKLSLLGYAASVTNGASGNRLGNLPTPDILNAAGTAILYDGFIDSGNRCLGSSGSGLPGVAGGNANKRCLGKFPIKDLPLALDITDTYDPVLGITDTHDPAGKVPWLAISPNLDFWDSCLNILNSEVLNFAFTPGPVPCPMLPTSSTTLPYPWLTVYDKDGTVLSSRVAAVLIMPGEAIATETRNQIRTKIAPGLPTDYLDSIQIPLGCTACTRTIDNAGLSNEFISIPPGTLYPADAQDVAKRGQPIKFNDVLVYITNDELMAFIEKRVLKEMASAVNELSNPAKKNIGFPWAVTFAASDTIGNFYMQPLQVVGRFPFFPDVKTPTPSGGYPPIRSNISWTVTGVSAPAKNCVQVQTGPNRWIDVRENIHTNIMSESASGTSSTCTWKGADKVDCTETGYTKPIFLKTFTRFSNNARCNAATPVADTFAYSVSRTISIPNIDLSCNSAPTVTYLGATASLPQRRTWSCSSVNTLVSTMTVNMTDEVSYAIAPFSSSATISINSPSATTTISNLRHQPLMPYWFYQNEWYKTAFYAVAPNRLFNTPCGTATSTLTMGGVALDNGLVILAGSRLPNLPTMPTQTRPSANITDYIEQTVTADYSNCIFKGNPIPASYNDRLLPVQ